MMNHLDHLIQLALSEDVGSGDITTNVIIDPDAHGTAEIRTKEPCIIAGIDIAQKVFQTLDTNMQWKVFCHNGDALEKGKTIAQLSGKLSTILIGERIALNFLQHLSGVATFTNRFVKAIAGTKAKILDTRKTLPGWRALEKEATKLGGATNHRMGLYDRYLIKNNHIAAAGGIREAIARVQQKRKKEILLEVETRTIKEVLLAIEANVDMIMLDHFSVEEVKKAVKEIVGRVKLEVSGNITLENVRSYAETGVDCISVGSITHSAPAADIHLIIQQPL